MIASGATLDLNGLSQTLLSLSDGTGGGGTVSSSAGGSATLTLAPASASSATFSGTIQNGKGLVNLMLNGADLHRAAMAGGEQYVQRQHERRQWHARTRQFRRPLE